jgi:hypothetical protein
MPRLNLPSVSYFDASFTSTVGAQRSSAEFVELGLRLEMLLHLRLKVFVCI